jgi:hypothetical protein
LNVESPQPTPELNQGLIRGCGLKNFLDSIISATDSDNTIPLKYTTDLILKSIPLDYFRSNNNVVELLLNSFEPLVVNGVVSTVRRFQDLNDFHTKAVAAAAVSDPPSASDILDDSQNMSLVDQWALYQKITSNTTTIDSQLLALLMKAANFKDGNNNIVHPTTIAGMRKTVGLLTTFMVDVVRDFGRIVKDNTFQNFVNAGFNWQELLFCNKFLSQLKGQFDIEISELVQFIGEQPEVGESQISELISSDSLALKNNLSKYYVAILAAGQIGFTMTDLTSLDLSAYSDLSHIAHDLILITNGTVTSESLLDRLALYSSESSGVVDSNKLLFKKVDTAVSIFNVLQANNGSGKKFSLINPLVSTPSEDYTSPSSDNLKKVGIAVHILENLHGNNADDKKFGGFPITMNDFFVNNDSFVDVVASLFYVKEIRNADGHVTSREIFERGIGGDGNRFTTTDKKSIDGLNEENNNKVVAKISGNNQVNISVITSNTSSDNDADAIKALLGLLNNQSFAANRNDILALQAGDWSNNKSALHVFILHSVASSPASDVLTKEVFNYNSVDLAALRVAMGEVESATLQKLVKSWSYQNLNTSTIKSFFNTSELETDLFASIRALLESETSVNGNLNNIYVYTPLMRQFSVSYAMQQWGQIVEKPAAPVSAFALWNYAYTSLADIEIIDAESDTTPEDLFSYLVESDIINPITSEVSGTIKKLLYKVQYVQTAYGLTDEETHNALAANRLTVSAPAAA